MCSWSLGDRLYGRARYCNVTGCKQTRLVVYGRLLSFKQLCSLIQHPPNVHEACKYVRERPGRGGTGDGGTGGTGLASGGKSRTRLIPM